MHLGSCPWWHLFFLSNSNWRFHSFLSPLILFILFCHFWILFCLSLKSFFVCCLSTVQTSFCVGHCRTVESETWWQPMIIRSLYYSSKSSLSYVGSCVSMPQWHRDRVLFAASLDCIQDFRHYCCPPTTFVAELALLFPPFLFLFCVLCRVECLNTYLYIPFFVMTLSLPRWITADSSHGCWMHATAIFICTQEQLYTYAVPGAF